MSEALTKWFHTRTTGIIKTREAQKHTSLQKHTSKLFSRNTTSRHSLGITLEIDKKHHFLFYIKSLWWMHSPTHFCAFAPKGCAWCCYAQIHTSEQETCQSGCWGWDPTHHRVQIFVLVYVCFLPLGLKNKNTSKLRRKAKNTFMGLLFPCLSVTSRRHL